MTLNRRQFLGTTASGAAIFGLSTLSLSPRFMRNLGKNGPPEKILVVLQLSGGNDALNTLVPFADRAYHAARPGLALKESEVLKLNDTLGLHPALSAWHKLHADGRLAIIQGVGYPDPIRSHFSSMDVWHAADARGRLTGRGWLGSLAESAWPDETDPNLLIHIGTRTPFAMQNRSHPAVTFSTPAAYRWVGAPEELATVERAAEACDQTDANTKPQSGRDRALDRIQRTLSDAHASSDRVREATRNFSPKQTFGANTLGASLATVAALIAAGLPTRIYSVEAGGYDTHNQQLQRQARCLTELDGLAAFQRELESLGIADRVVTMVFSEFGRRVAENGSGGTDHGAGGHMFMMGSKVKGGLYGNYPSLTTLERGDMIFTTDFRRVYSSITSQWFGIPPGKVLAGNHEALALL
ncbi:MAG: DUF1501 domain-containing protein [Planctomycetes bacterium]|nr:DUF1501 domain-containing protein [Planctomycetota bacterium]